jgi:hypothetical protein
MIGSGRRIKANRPCSGIIRAQKRRRGGTRINSHGSTRKALASRPKTVTLADTAVVR